jgi:hypothetical protein
MSMFRKNEMIYGAESSQILKDTPVVLEHIRTK